jgi:hypothetical protein
VSRAAAAALAVAALAAGCGSSGGGNGSLPDGAAKAPADARAFVSLKTDPSSGQWKQTLALARKFPALAPQLGRLERYKDAAGAETDVVWLDFANGGRDVVLLTKPRNLAKLKTLVEPDSSSHEKLSGGWVAVGDRPVLDRFRRDGDKLDGDKSFKGGFAKLDESSAIRAWVRGRSVQDALDRALVEGGAAPRITHDAGDLGAVTAEARAAPAGVRFDAYGLIDPPPNVSAFSPSLQSVVPAGALLYVGAAGLDRPTRLILRMVGDSKPNFGRQLAQVQSVLGISLKNDVYPLLKGESALALYPRGPVPGVLFLQKVADEGKAAAVLERIGAVAQLSGEAQVVPVRIGAISGHKLTFKGSSVSVYDGVTHGYLFVADTIELARQVVEGGGRTLGDEPLFRQARQSAKLPSKVAAVAYGDLRRGLPFVFSLARRSGQTLPPAAVPNTKPLQHALVYLAADGDGLRVSGFTAIK